MVSDVKCDCIHDPSDHDPVTGGCVRVNDNFGPCPCAATPEEQYKKLEARWYERRHLGKPK